MLLPLMLLASTAQAADLSVGLLSTVNDPFLSRTGLLVSGHMPLGDRAMVGLVADYALDRGEGQWTPLTTQLVNENSVSPDISKVTWQVGAVVGVEAIRTPLASGAAVLRVYGGPAFLSSRDDLDALQAQGDPRAESTAIQTHTGLMVGLTSDWTWSERAGVRLRLQRVTHIETVNATTLELKRDVAVGLEYVVGTFGGEG